MKRNKKDEEGKIKCSICGREIVNERYVRCTRCIAAIECLECYSVECDCEPPSDQKDLNRCYHQFMLMDSSPQPIFRSDWDSNDEVILLNCVRLLGVGNWETIAEWLKPRTAAEIEAHYMQTYILSETSPFPDPSVHEPAIVPQPPGYNTKPQESYPSEGHVKHLSQKNKKEATNPAEYSGWMPYRHEFESEYNNDAEELVANIEFKDESQQSFEEKINFLQSYNIQLRERHARIKVIEDWDVHHLEQRGSSKSDNDLETRLLGGTTREQKEIDSKLLPLMQYMKKEDILRIAQDTHELLQLSDQIERCQKWQEYGVHSTAEGLLFDTLESCHHEGKMTNGDVETWNRSIDNFNRKNKRDLAPELELLTAAEVELCNSEGINTKIYFAVKDLLLREYAIRGGLSVEEATGLASGISGTILPIYKFLIAHGYIFE
ncbi:Myb-like DNA-binding domain containing protein [Trichomonas vaginalis G3]|uniref:Myb-like DNA-binding domain containing protein n=1 Tax=Trichomonas vaginalis (strain ATCC PRA-98 / G3) TaxID=412133 RepID=A2F6F3_TRIV3|nr:positive regulation of histone acetylation [Trichomonas vaginalis G3]EAX99511.1 Myb-like DNA-binding domain containing protein [Trichomonas vaginalis G3]KAI5535646.1 positive regulation of histone acetylation [Trichomonas vaginalis G3]|eukprot:XP_001312441.1 Myb-like DNA-binding domain containing protein [Trichomonas vaginalis G3]